MMLCYYLRMNIPLQVLISLFSLLFAVEVMDKFNDLRGQYQKCLWKIRNAPSGSAATTPIKWEHYKTCSFMQSAYDLGPTESSFIHPDDLVSLAKCVYNYNYILRNTTLIET